MNDYIKRADALKLFAGGGKYPEGSFQRRLGELGERLVMQIPFANVVEGDEYDRLLRKWEKVSKECAQDAQIVPVDFDWRATWVKAADATPPKDIEVLVSCKTASGERYQCIACCYEDGEQTEYYYVDPEWHKGTRTWEEIRPAVRIKDTVTHWMRLPTFPKRLPND